MGRMRNDTANPRSVKIIACVACAGNKAPAM